MAERLVDVLVVRWYERRDRSPGILDRWVAAAREHLPEAMPRRFGDTEPLRGRFDRDGIDGLRRVYDAADPLLFLTGTPPIHHAAWAAGKAGGPVAVHALHAVTGPAAGTNADGPAGEPQAGDGPADETPAVARPADRTPAGTRPAKKLPAIAGPADERVRAFALALAHPGTLYISASVAAGMTLDRSTLYGPAQVREELYLAPRGDWHGLPPAPPAWCWFGPAYARRVPGRERSGGRWYEGGPWVDESLRARLDEADPARRYARRTPRGTRRSLLRLLTEGTRTRRR